MPKLHIFASDVYIVLEIEHKVFYNCTRYDLCSMNGLERDEV